MSGLRPIGSEKLEGMDKIKRIMEIARYNENTPSRLNENESTEYGISLSDGNHYEIVKEKQGYIIKRSINESVSDYIEPMKNRRYYSSYSQALKKLNLMAKEFNTLHENSEGTSLFSEQKKKFKLKLPKAKSTEAPEPVVEPTPEPVTPPVTPPMEGGDVPPMGGDVPPMEGGDVPPMEGGDVPPMGDMGSDEGSTDASDTYDDMGSSSSSDGYDDDMGSKKDGKVSMKLIQKLIGKSAQKIRAYLSKDDMDSNDVKYIINSILSSLDLSALDEDDVEEIISRLEGTDEDDDEDMGLDDDEDIDFGDEEMASPEEPVSEPSGEMEETYGSYADAFSDYMGGSYSNELMNEFDDDDDLGDFDIKRYGRSLETKAKRVADKDIRKFISGEDGFNTAWAEIGPRHSVDYDTKFYFDDEDDERDDHEYPKHGARDRIRRYPHERSETMYESIIDKVINKHINETEIKVSESKTINKTKEKIVNLSESIRQERSALKFLEKNPESFLVGSTSKGNLLFKTGLKENKITPDGKVL
jgi:hypothetical protein